MEPQVFFNWIGGIATAILLGYVSFVRAELKQAKTDNEKIAKDLADFKLKVAETHPTDADMREIRDSLVRIERDLREALNRKVDK